MRILVTGASGFLGQHLCRKLELDGHELLKISSKNCDLRNYENLKILTTTKFDQIYHLAAWTQAGDFCLDHAGEQWLINQQINTNVLRWWKEEQPQAKLIAIGSSCCYEPGTPHKEENFLRGQPIESLYTYAMTKRMLYTGLLALHKQFGLRYLMLVPSTLYGSDYHTDGRQMHFIFDLVRKILEGKEQGKEVVLWGDGTQRRELIHVRDFVEAMTTLASTVDNQLVNIGGGHEYSIKWFAERISDAVGFDSSLIKYDTSKYVGATSKLLVIDKLNTLLPDRKTIDLAEGISEISEWMRSKFFLSKKARIGIDFDNTIILYDELFYNLAKERGWIDGNVPINKRAVRDALRAKPNGDLLWQELQALAYGECIEKAKMAPGFARFIKTGRQQGLEFFVVSHKTKVSPINPNGPDLREAALRWMESSGFFEGEELGFKREQVFFESERDKKITRIVELGCGIFIDDLIEVFEEPLFPKAVKKIYFSPETNSAPEDLELCRSWEEVTKVVLDG